MAGRDPPAAHRTVRAVTSGVTAPATAGPLRVVSYLTVTVIFFMTGMPAAITGRSAPLTWGNS